MKPSRTLLALVAALFGLAFLLGLLPLLGLRLPQQLNTMWWGLLASLSLLALVDAVLLRRMPSPLLQRSLPGNLPLGRSSDVQLNIQHQSQQPVCLQLFDHLPDGLHSDDFPLSLDLLPQRKTQCSYQLHAQRRGHFQLNHCELLLPSPGRLWQQRRVLELSNETRVYPDFARLHGAQLMGVDHWLSQLGVRQHQRRGLGMEFHQLRDFHDGDSLRQIDWKATARKRSPIAREYTDERDQQIVFLLDCGRRMRSQDGELAHFDHALNACLLLSYVALRQGDAVGLSTFATEQQRFLAPAKGNAQLSHLLNSVYDLHSSQQPADFSAAINQLLARQKRRALVVVISNLRDEDDSELLGALKRLGRRHLVLLASLREDVLDNLRQQPVDNYEQALTYCGTVDYLNARNKLHERLAAHGMPVLDARPNQLGPELVGRYLAWKKAGVL